MPGIGCFFWSCYQWGLRDSLTLQAVVTAHGYSPDPKGEGTTYVNQNMVRWDVSFLLESFHSAGRCHGSYQRRRVVISHIHLWILGATIMTGLESHVSWRNSGMNIMGDTNHFLVGFKSFSIRWNPYKSEAPKENLLLPFCQMDTVLSWLLKIYCYTIEQCISHPHHLSEELLFCSRQWST